MERMKSVRLRLVSVLVLLRLHSTIAAAIRTPQSPRIRRKVANLKKKPREIVFYAHTNPELRMGKNCRIILRLP